MPETETLTKQMYFAVDAKDLPGLAQRILDGGIPVVVTWGSDQRRIKPARADVKRDPYGRSYIEVEGQVEGPDRSD
ncbi:MAG TPA: hypothetical protein VJ578_01610 [Dehalococcoidia bacterium]|nr:hypothetical protein [Dehalococcoidia bacterium]